MYPMQWFWAPQLHFPWSGGVAQQIELDRFFDAIPPEAGNGKIERKAFDVASYGRQLGWISEVLLDLVSTASPSSSDDVREALKNLVEANKKIQRIKLPGNTDRAMTVQTIEDAVVALRKRDGEQFKLLSERLLPLLQASSVQPTPPAPPALVMAGG